MPPVVLAVAARPPVLAGSRRFWRPALTLKAQDSHPIEPAAMAGSRAPAAVRAGRVPSARCIVRAATSHTRRERSRIAGCGVQAIGPR